MAMIGLSCVSANALSIVVETDIRPDTKVYVNRGDITLADMHRIGLDHVPVVTPGGSIDDEGYCKVDWISLSELMYFGGSIKKGETLKVVGQFTSQRQIVQHLSNGTIAIGQITDTLTNAQLSDGKSYVTIGCSINSSGSEGVPYLPVTSDLTKAYLTLLKMYVVP